MIDDYYARKGNLTTIEQITLKKIAKAKARIKKSQDNTKRFCDDRRTTMAYFVEARYNGQNDWLDFVCSWAEGRDNNVP